MGVELSIIVTLIFIILGALIAIHTRELLSAIISLGVVGFGVSIAFLFLRAPDLAIVQIAVEVVLLILLIRATIKRDIKPTGSNIHWVGLIFISVILLAFMGFGYLAFSEKDISGNTVLEFGDPAFAKLKNSPSSVYIKHGLEQRRAANIVSAVILDYRAYDTLGEATVLFTAIIGALAILRARARKKKGDKT